MNATCVSEETVVAHRNFLECFTSYYASIRPRDFLRDREGNIIKRRDLQVYDNSKLANRKTCKRFGCVFVNSLISFVLNVEDLQIVRITLKL